MLSLATHTQEFRDKYPVSPSQIETARLCWRKWGLNKLDGIPAPPNVHAQRGTDAHAVLEKWMRNGMQINTDTAIGKIVSAGLRFLPRPGTKHVEDKFRFRTPNATYLGVQDLRGKKPVRIQDVWDHKTTTSFKWMKIPEILRQDPQANIYAMAEIEAMVVFSRGQEWEWERIEQNWVYYLANPEKPQARKVQLHVLAGPHVAEPKRPKDVLKDNFGFMYFEELKERFVEIEGTASQILEYRKLHEEGKIKGSQLPYDATACGAFGGCPYANKACKLTVRERIDSMEAKLSLKEKMEKAKLLQGAAAGDPKPDEKPAAAGKSNGKPAAASSPKPSAAAAADKIKKSAVKKQDELPATNPPEQANGTDPDDPKNKTGAGATSQQKISAGDRMNMTALAMQGLLASGQFIGMLSGMAPEVGVDTVSKMSVRIADAVLEELARNS